MEKESRKKDKYLTTSFKMVTAIMLGMIILLSVYIYSNYVVAAPFLYLPDVLEPGTDSPNITLSVPTLNHLYESPQEPSQGNLEPSTELLFSL